MTDSLPNTEEAQKEQKEDKRRDVKIIDKGDYTIFNFHGSVYGDCKHRQVMSLQNPDVNPQDESEDSDFLKNKFKGGHRAEDWMKERLARKGWAIRGGGHEWKDQVSVSMWGNADATDNAKDRLLLANHLDGVISRESKGLQVVRRLEGKNLGVKGFKALKDDPFAIDQYAWQMSSAAWGNERGERGDYRKAPMPVLMVVTAAGKYADEIWDKDAEKYIPNPYPDDERFFSHIITEPKYSAEECLERCRGILRLWRDGICPECDAYYPCRWKRWERDLNTEEADESQLVPGYVDITIGDLVVKFGNLRAEAKLVSQELEEAKAELVTGLAAIGIVNGDRRIIGAATVNLSKAGRLTVTGV